jgi:hypothetical protein
MSPAGSQEEEIALDWLEKTVVPVMVRQGDFCRFPFL